MFKKTPAIAYNRRALRQFCRKERIRLAILFGSQAKRRSHGRSDVDLALSGPTTLAHSLRPLAFADPLEAIFERRFSVDVVLLSDETDPVLKWEIFSEGIPLYENQRGLFQEERYKAWLLFNDTAPLRRLRGQMIDHFLKKVA